MKHAPIAMLAAALTLVSGGARAAPATASAPEAATEKPRLVVVISVDQFSANLFDQWRGRFTGGFRALADEGVVYINGYQSHAGTETCPGHSTLLTGRHPNKTGITANAWFDRLAGKSVYCMATGRFLLAHDPTARPVGPETLRADTLGDWLKSASPASKVVGVSGKDRAAITMTGKAPDGAFWYAPGYGFTTYVARGEAPAPRLAPVAALNTRIRGSLAAGPPDWTYADPACRALEASHVLGGEAWMSRLPPLNWGGTSETAMRLYTASPFFDELVLDAARSLIESYALGRDAAPDLLAVSLSATDYIGHRYGTQGPEMCDHLHRLDAALGRFLVDLRKVDPDVMVVLAADHGGSDFPERNLARGFTDAGRVPPDWLDRLNAELTHELGLAHAPLVAGDDGDPTQLYVVGPDGKGAPPALITQVVDAALPLIRRDSLVSDAFAVAGLAQAPLDGPPQARPDEYSLRRRVQLSTVPDRTGDIFVVFRPLVTTYGDKIGQYISGHGSPYDYDRRVPIIFWRAGQPAQERPFPVDTTDIAPTLAAALGLTPPADVDGRNLELPAVRAEVD